MSSANANLATACTPDSDTVGSTEKIWLLGDDSNARPNAAVHRIEVSCADPGAVLLVRVGRSESTDTLSAQETPRFLRGNLPTHTPAGLDNLETGSMGHVHGKYYVSGGQPLVVDFIEPLEALKDWQSTTDMAVAIGVKRADTSTAVGYHIVVWHEEY